MQPEHFSPAAERNKQPILEVLGGLLAPSGRALEIASGTGQHVTWFAQHLPGWHWQPSDLTDDRFNRRSDLRKQVDTLKRMGVGDYPPYLSIALPGRMFAPAYRGKGYSTLNLSRAIEEGGTLISPLVPWNAGGAIVITALGLGVADGNFENLLYIPLAFACWMSPVIGIIYAYLGWFSPQASAAEKQRWHDLGEAIQIMNPKLAQQA